MFLLAFRYKTMSYKIVYVTFIPKIHDRELRQNFYHSPDTAALVQNISSVVYWITAFQQQITIWAQETERPKGENISSRQRTWLYEYSKYVRTSKFRPQRNEKGNNRPMAKHHIMHSSFIGRRAAKRKLWKLKPINIKHMLESGVSGMDALKIMQKGHHRRHRMKTPPSFSAFNLLISYAELGQLGNYKPRI